MMEPLLNKNHFGQIYSSGWRSAQGGQATIVEPASGREIGMTGIASSSDVAEAAARAHTAQREWGNTSPLERGQVLRRAAELLEAHFEEFAEMNMRESGAIRGKAENEVQGSIGELVGAAALGTAPYGELLPSDRATAMSFARRVPIGVVGVITPWNFPLILAMRAVAPALALGNAVVLKPDHQTPFVGGHMIARLLEEAGLPDGLLHVLPGAGDTGAALVDDRHVGMISFTGSTATGRRVGAAASASLKKVHLELGGNNAIIVLDDADVEHASSIGAWGSFLHQGQICLTTGRHLVHESLAEEYSARLVERANALKVGDPMHTETALGPVINESQRDRVHDIVQRSVASGARVRAGGTYDGLFYRPTVLDNVDGNTPAFQEEIFGPVAPITIFANDDEALALANSTSYGLTASIQTRNLTRGLEIAKHIRSGMVHINDTTVNDQPHVPFGGMGDSGSGARHGGSASFEDYTQWQWVTVHDSPVEYPF